MKDDEEKTGVHAFIIRIWSEAANADSTQLIVHGSIQDVGTQEVLHFYQLTSILSFIEERLHFEKGLRFQKLRNLLAKVRNVE